MSNKSINDLLNIPTEIVYKNKTYKLRRPTILEQAKFSTRLKRRALAAPAQIDDPEQRERLERAVARDIGSGYYEIDAPGYLEALRHPGDFTYLLYLILHADDNSFTEADAAGLVEQSLREILFKLAVDDSPEEAKDPKWLAAVLQSLGLPKDYLNTNTIVSSD